MGSPKRSKLGVVTFAAGMVASETAWRFNHDR
jgi:hypothetical protein